MGRTCRSPLRLRRSPWIADDDLERILLLRGAFVAAAGQIETILTELAIRASKHPSYDGVRLDSPPHRAERFRYLKDISALEGPLSRYQKLMVRIVDLFEGATDLRDLFAHARMEAFSGSSDGVTMRFTDWQIKRKKKQPTEIYHRSRPMKLTELERFARRITRLSRTVESLYYRLESVLPPVG